MWTIEPMVLKGGHAVVDDIAKKIWRGRCRSPSGHLADASQLLVRADEQVAIPPEWPRFLGLDFGGVNTAGVFFAEERDAYHRPTGRLFAYREYRAGDRSAAEHCWHHLMKGDKLNPPRAAHPLVCGRVEVGRPVAPGVRRRRHGEQHARAGHPDPRARQAGGAEYRGRHQPRVRGVRLESDASVFGDLHGPLDELQSGPGRNVASKSSHSRSNYSTPVGIASPLSRRTALARRNLLMRSPSVGESATNRERGTRPAFRKSISTCRLQPGAFPLGVIAPTSRSSTAVAVPLKVICLHHNPQGCGVKGKPS